MAVLSPGLVMLLFASLWPVTAAEPKLHVIGVGYGRTGTDSLREALTILGYKTFHTSEMLHDPPLFDHFYEAAFRFDEAQLRSPDLTLVAKAGYNASMDMPMAMYYPRLLKIYPGAKYILTVRSSPEVWLSSWRSLIETISLLPRFAPFIPNVFKLDRYNRWLMALLHGDDAFLTLPHPKVTAAQDGRAIDSYKAHNAGVRRRIPKRQLLELDLSEGRGWEPLCLFLRAAAGDCPDARGVPFPQTNARAPLRTKIQVIVAVANGALLLIAVASAAAVRVAVRRRFSAMFSAGHAADQRQRHGQHRTAAATGAKKGKGKGD